MAIQGVQVEIYKYLGEDLFQNFQTMCKKRYLVRILTSDHLSIGLVRDDGSLLHHVVVKKIEFDHLETNKNVIIVALQNIIIPYEICKKVKYLFVNPSNKFTGIQLELDKYFNFLNQMRTSIPIAPRVALIGTI